ncbi:FAD/NAD(P)-binding protein [Natronoflexus pectinivorans]|uniref:FAD-NAD(P)-binding protein n=1 Tax=Natronoflexus pectinivorans TaxID=682526 RepID=A0A4R2GP08_9BACT|nr:FAD/NAD(P)-binding protein [Natronoflexus pectinivorans]TCO11084.1 FAD-NAD(P)-binding protein [Natronoflexus pectinivorans]
MKVPPFKIAIIGLGPKGLYGFERILAQLKANPTKEKVEIHLFNKTRFMGSGDIYRSDQPGYLLMNFANKHINMWTEESPPPVVEDPLSFSEYISLETQTPQGEIESLYASRATVGCYLEKGFARLKKNLPENVILQQHILEVRSVEKMDEVYSIGFMQGGKKCWLTDFQNILITTGHQRHKEATDKNHSKVSFIYPVQQKLNEWTQQNTVAVKGMGLTFIDAVLALTEGKGGFFTKNNDGKYIYKASGREPKRIFPFSKSGWPIMPKYDFNLKNDYELFVKRLKLLNHKKLSFKYEILPLIERDMGYTYYSTLFTHEREMLEYHPNYDVINRQIETFHQKHPGYARFSLDKLLEPEFNSSKCNHQNILEYLTAFTNENNRDIEHEAQLRAASVWRRISPIFNDIYSFSGLDAASHQEFDEYYFGKLNRIAYGPPPENLKKMIALANTGIVDFRFAKSPNIEPFKNGYMLSNGISENYCDILIDARIPKNSIEKEVTGLFINLCKNHLARPYENRDKNMNYAPGTLEIDRNGNLINPQGKAENITLYGTPTESIVHDNDTLSRTRNNFASSWSLSVMQHIINYTNANIMSTVLTNGSKREFMQVPSG